MTIGCTIPVRNDNYGGRLNDRATFCINSAISTYDKVFLVDWNSETHPLLWDIKDNLQLKGNLHHIVITPEVASVLTNNDPNAQKCNEVLARNLGLRRLDTDWMISSNIDIIAPKREQLEDTISKLDDKTFYTISRRPLEWSTIESYFQENYGKQMVFEAWPSLRDFLILNSEERHYNESVNNSDKYSLINCCGDFQIASRNIWNEIRGFEEDLIYVLYSDTNVQKKAVMHGFDLKALYSPALFHINHGRGGAGFLDGINKRVNDMHRAVTFQHHTQNKQTWGFSDIEIEYEVL